MQQICLDHSDRLTDVTATQAPRPQGARAVLADPRKQTKSSGHRSAHRRDLSKRLGLRHVAVIRICGKCRGFRRVPGSAQGVCTHMCHGCCLLGRIRRCLGGRRWSIARGGSSMSTPASDGLGHIKVSRSKQSREPDRLSHFSVAGHGHLEDP